MNEETLYAVLLVVWSVTELGALFAAMLGSGGVFALAVAIYAHLNRQAVLEHVDRLTAAEKAPTVAP